MGRIKLCVGDPIINSLRSVFPANIIRIPEERVQPLSVVAAQGKQTRWWGTLDECLDAASHLDVPGEVRGRSGMANLSDRQTSEVGADLGLSLLDGFLSGFGVQSATGGLNASRDTKVAFAFAAVERQYVDTAWLSRTIPKLGIDTDACSIFINKPQWAFLVVDSVIVSNAFTMTVVKEADAGAHIDLPSLEQVVKASAKVTATRTSERSISFEGTKALPFAFTSVLIQVQRSGSLSSVPDKVQRTLAATPVTEGVVYAGLPHIELSAVGDVEMIEFDA